jgi:adenine-specific DNA-methyltransferase
MSTDMYSIGLFLKQIREEKGLQLQDVNQRTKINLSLLSRIETGKRLPTNEQINKLAKEYEYNEKELLIHLVSDRVLIETEKIDFGLEALQLAESKIINLSSKDSDKSFNIESRRYIGSKAKLTKWILESILQESKKCSSFTDLFAGTASVAKSAFAFFENVKVNDILYSNNIIYKAYFGKGEFDIEKLQKIINTYNSLVPEKIKENYFSKNFGNKFFEMDVSKVIGYIREDIEKRKKELSDKEYSILLATLIYNIDKLANTVGHFDAYIKKPIRKRELKLRLIEPAVFDGVEIFQEDANSLVRKIKSDIVYIDPPYNSRQYSRFYHLYETLIKWDKPKLFGVALKPEPENMSLYSTVKARDTFEDLINNIDAKFIVVSYNNTYNSKSNSSENKIKLEEIEEILNKRGKTKVLECSHKFFNSGKTEFNNHKELLFITKINSNG